MTQVLVGQGTKSKDMCGSSESRGCGTSSAQATAVHSIHNCIVLDECWGRAKEAARTV